MGVSLPWREGESGSIMAEENGEMLFACVDSGVILRRGVPPVFGKERAIWAVLFWVPA